MIVQTSEATFSKPLGYVVDPGSIRNRLSENENPILSLLQITRIKKVLIPYIIISKEKNPANIFFFHTVCRLSLRWLVLGCFAF